MSLLLSFTLFASAHAQKDIIDSLKTVLTTQAEDTSKVLTLNYLSEEFYITNRFDSSLHYASMAYQLADSLHFSTGLADAVLNIGIISLQHGKYLQALERFFEGLTLFEELNNTIGIAYSYELIGSLYQSVNNHDEAGKYFLKSLDVAEKSNDSLRIAQIFNDLGMLFDEKENYDEALRYYLKFIELNKHLGFDADIAIAYNNIGIVYMNLKDYEKGLEYLNKSLEISEQYDDKYVLSHAAVNLGDVYEELGDYTKALKYNFLSLNTCEEINYLDGAIYACLNIGYVYSLMDNYKDALAYLEKALKFGREAGSLELINDASKELSDFYFKTKDYKKAYEYFQMYKSMSDSLFNNLKQIEIGKLTANYEFDKKLKIHTFEKQQKDLVIKNQKALNYSLLAIVLLGLVLILFLIQRYRYIKKTSKKLNEQQEIIHHKEKELIYEKNNRLQESLDNLHRELTSKAMFIVQNTKQNKFIFTNLEGIMRNIENEPGNVKKIKSEIKSLINNIRVHSGKGAWKEFELRFEQVHESFYKNLHHKFPNLSQNDRKLCALLRLGLSTKDISAITFQNLNSIQVARTRLRKKLDLSNTEINLTRFLSEI